MILNGNKANFRVKTICSGKKLCPMMGEVSLETLPNVNNIRDPSRDKDLPI